MTAKTFREHDQITPLLIITEHDGHFYSKPQLSNAFKLNKQPDELIIKKRELMAQELNAGIVADTCVVNFDPATQKIFLNNGESFAYHKLVLALGAKPITLRLEGDAANQVVAVNHLQAYRDFRQRLDQAKRVVIIGTGLVGMEFANDWRNAGFEVAMASNEAQPLAQLAPEAIGRALQQKLADKGLQFHMQNPVVAVNHAGEQLAVSLQDGTTLNADVVLSAIGIKPNIELAHKAGLQTERGIVVNELMQTSDANIYAIGDCAQLAEVKLFIAPLLHAAKCLGKTLAGTPTVVEYPLAPIVVKTPDYPVVVAIAPGFQIDGSWQIESLDDGIRALAYQGDRLIAFALSGVCTKEKMQWLKELKA